MYDCVTVARVLIVGGGARGRRLASVLVREGHAVRIVTRTEHGRAAIETCGAECLIGDPGRLATLRGALDGVTIACWLLASATGSADELHALHGARLEAFMSQAIDSAMRGFVYEAHGPAAEGERVVARIAESNAIPVAYVRADPADGEVWLSQARGAIARLLDPGSHAGVRYPEA